MTININPEKVLKLFLLVIFMLLIANILGIVSKYYFDHDHVYGLVTLFDFSTEKNIPTYYSSFALTLASLLLVTIASTHKGRGTPWLAWMGLAILFLFIAIDEAISIHEGFVEPVRESLNPSGLLYYGWVIPYGIATVVIALGYLRFLIQLPRQIMILFILSGGIFVTGAIGFELLEGRQVDLYGSKTDPLYLFYYTCEEFLEMLGIVIFIYALLTYIKNHFPNPIAVSFAGIAALKFRLPRGAAMEDSSGS